MSLTRHPNAKGQPIYYHILPVCPIIFVPGDFNPFLTMQMHGRQWLSEYHPFEVPGSKRPSEALEVGKFGENMADIESDGGWDLLG